MPEQGGVPLTHEVATPAGIARVHFDLPAGPARLLLVLGHGAGGGVSAPDLLAVRSAAASQGAVVARVEQPYRVAGRRSPAPAAALDTAWLAVCADLRVAHPGLPLVAGGRSSGARVACRTAIAAGARGVLCLAFPLHPPGRPDKSRYPELLGAGVPALVVNGERDPFGVPEPAPGVVVHVVAGADHALRRGLDEVVVVVTDWLRRLTGRRSRQRSPR